MDIQTIRPERKKVDSNDLAVGATALTSGGVGAFFAWALLKWLLNHQTKQLEVSIELQRQALQRLDKLCELLEGRNET